MTLLGLFLGSIALSLALVVLLVFSWMTVYQRIRHIQQTLAAGGPMVDSQPVAPGHSPGPALSQEPPAAPPSVPFRDDPDSD